MVYAAPSQNHDELHNVLRALNENEVEQLVELLLESRIKEENKEEKKEEKQDVDILDLGQVEHLRDISKS